MRSELRTMTAAFAAPALLAAALSGCGPRTMVDASLVDNPAIAADQGDFLDALRTQAIVTNNDSLHGLFLLADGADPHEDFAGRVASAKERGWLEKDWNFLANESVRVGDVAQGVCVITDIKGGLTMGMFGPSPRYCTRELVYLEMIPDRDDAQSMRGLEYLELMLKANDRLEAENRPQSVEERLQKYSQDEAGTVPVDDLGPAPAAPALPGNPEPGSPEDPGQNPPRN